MKKILIALSIFTFFAIVLVAHTIYVQAWDDGHGKFIICHCERTHCETKHLPLNEANGHIKNHKRDYEGACRDMSPTPTIIDPTATPEATPSPTIDITPTIEATPSATPTEQPKEEKHEAVSSSDPSAHSEPSCDTTRPNRPEFITLDNPVQGDGAIKLLFPKVLNAETVNVYYGEYGYGDQHGIANYPNSGSVDIAGLKDVNYNFCIEGKSGCAVGPRLCIDPLP